VTAPIDPVALTAELIRCPSVTPEEGGAIALLERTLARLGFACTRISRGGVENLYARWGTGTPVFAFNGHTDVVPVGERAAWTRDPFGGEIVDGVLWGRGATDMKSGVAAFVAAALRARECGFDGVEVFHPYHNPPVVTRLLGLARDRGLLISGGSDFHGIAGRDNMGEPALSFALFERIREAVAQRRKMQ